MNTQLNFLEIEKRERNAASMAKIIAIGHYQEKKAQINELLTKSIPNSTVISAQYGIKCTVAARTVALPELPGCPLQRPKGSRIASISPWRFKSSPRHQYI